MRADCGGGLFIALGGFGALADNRHNVPVLICAGAMVRSRPHLEGRLAFELFEADDGFERREFL